MPQQKRTMQSSQRYWGRRSSRLVLRSTNVCQLNSTRAARRSERLRKTATRKEELLRSYSSYTIFGSRQLFTQAAQDLQLWVQHGSWIYCSRCGSLHTKRFLPAFRRRTKPSSSVPCTCSTGRYQVPHPTRIPAPLRNLTMDEVYAPRPLRAFSGHYTRMMFGYRMR